MKEGRSLSILGILCSMFLGGVVLVFESKMKRFISRKNLGFIEGKCFDKRIIRFCCILLREFVEFYYLVILMNKT